MNTLINEVQATKTMFGAVFTVNKKLDDYQIVTSKAKLDLANTIAANLDMEQLNALILEKESNEQMKRAMTK